MVARYVKNWALEHLGFESARWGALPASISVILVAMLIKQTNSSFAAMVLGAAIVCGSSACSKSEASAEQEVSQEAAVAFVIEEPTEPVTHMELVEDLSEEVADWLLEFSDKLKRRDF